MKEDSIPSHWESYKHYVVEAENLQEAVTKAVKQFLSEPDENYISESFQIDESIDWDYTDEEFDINETYKEL